MRDLLRVGCVGLILATLTLGGHSWSAAPKTSAARPRSGIGLLNLSYVISKYEKLIGYQNELKVTIVPFQAKETAIKAEATKLLEEKQDDNTPAKRKKQIDRRLTEVQRAMEDLKNEFNEFMNKKQEVQVKIVYKDIEAAVRRHAKAHDLELVMHYNDGIKPAERDSPQNIMRKMQAGTCMPIYAVPGIDISNEIIAALNADLRRRKGI